MCELVTQGGVEEHSTLWSLPLRWKSYCRKSHLIQAHIIWRMKLNISKKVCNVVQGIATATAYGLFQTKKQNKKINMLVWSSTDGNYHYSGCSVIQLTDTFKLTSGSIIKLYTRVTERTKIMLTPARVLLQKGPCWTCQRQSVFLINRLTDTSARQWLTPKWKSPCGALIVNTFSVYIDHFSQERIVCFLYLASNWQVDLLPTGLKLGSQCGWLKWFGSG